MFYIGYWKIFLQQRGKIELFKILRETNKTTAALPELKGFANTIPNQSMLVNAIVLQEAKDSYEIKNIIPTQDELYKVLTAVKNLFLNQ